MINYITRFFQIFFCHHVLHYIDEVLYQDIVGNYIEDTKTIRVFRCIKCGYLHCEYAEEDK